MNSPNTRWNAPARERNDAPRSAAGRRRGDTDVSRRGARRDDMDQMEFDPFVERDCVAALALETGLALLGRGEND